MCVCAVVHTCVAVFWDSGILKIIGNLTLPAVRGYARSYSLTCAVFSVGSIVRFTCYSSCAFFMWSRSSPPDDRAAAAQTALHSQARTHSHLQPRCQERFVCVCAYLLQRGRERGSCGIKPSSTVPLDCPICPSINTHSHFHTLIRTHSPSVDLSATHGALHTQWALWRQWRVFSVLCEENRCQLCPTPGNTTCGIFFFKRWKQCFKARYDVSLIRRPFEKWWLGLWWCATNLIIAW